MSRMDTIEIELSLQVSYGHYQDPTEPTGLACTTIQTKLRQQVSQKDNRDPTEPTDLV